MKKNIILTLLCFTVFFSQAQKTTKTDLQTMLTWFEGEFDNHVQYLDEREAKTPDSLAHERIHSIFKRTAMPALGENVFWVQQYMDGDPKMVYRQRIYNFTMDKKEKAIRLDIYQFVAIENEKKYFSSYQKDSLAKITPAQLKTVTGCEVYWKRLGSTFYGYMKDNACSFVSKRLGGEVRVTDSLQLRENEIWIRDEMFTKDGKRIFGNPAHIHHKLQKCAFYKGWFIIRKGDNHDVELPKGEKDEWLTMKDLRLYDKGQRVQLVTKEGEKTKYFVELSQVIYGKDVPVLKLAFYEEGREKAIAYTWTTPDAKRIGLNMRWIQAGFTRE